MGLATPGVAQREYYNWYFGDGAGFTFLSKPITALPPGSSTLYLDVSCMSDSAGTLQFVAEGRTIYNRNFRVMKGGQLGSPALSGSEVMAVPQPGRPGRYYVFVPRHWFAPTPTVQYIPPNLSYFIVDMRREGGLGEVLPGDSAVTLPLVKTPYNTVGGYVGSDIAAVRHSNGRDVWLVVKNDQQHYLSFLLDARGLHTQPVVTPNPMGRRLDSGPGLKGLLKASVDGRTLAYANFSLLLDGRGSLRMQRMVYLEISRFDAGTGRVSSSYVIGDSLRYRISSSQTYGGTGGLEFSPDGSRLYTDTLRGASVWQYDLTAGTPAAIGASRTVVAPNSKMLSNSASGNNLQLGPDGYVYHVNSSSKSVARFEAPNAKGSNAAYQKDALFFAAGTQSTASLPHALNDLGLRPVVVTGAGSIAVKSVCVGDMTQFASSLSPFLAAASYAWDFGDPASGALNKGVGQAPAHYYALGGTYTVTLTVTATSGQAYTITQQVQALPRPAVDLGQDFTLCYGQNRVLSAPAQPAGTTFRWQDGSTDPQLTVAKAGRYRLTVTNTSGCSATDELLVTQQDCGLIPNIITPNKDDRNEYFVLQGLQAADWNLVIYNRWGRQVYQKASYDNSWNAPNQPDGVYFYLLQNPRTGQQIKGAVEVVH
ncbi:gliding motility-associated-like protein [Hymenobacter chitinivorans DSM 11115]|uniref:Gliding motility-associated-like protein n=2 Tax=Hymenobacter chitinivorans TaxID=89969 RepID=A0A2M9BPB6_9BACT|nr:gliding motility-associated-like protein [Hymenobacter chitinivorans DSM 11115]